MNLPAISLGALFVVVFISCVTRLNVGVLAVAMAWIVGAWFGGYKVEQIAAGFPIQLFLTLVGMTMLFSQAQLNGTLDKLARHAVRGCRGNVGVMPIMFFLLAAALASIGPGNIAAAALVAPMAMAVAARASVPAFLMAIMVGNGANAGSLSPFAPTGIIVNGLMQRIGLPGLEWRSYLTNLAVHAGVALLGYLIFGGFRLFALRADPVAAERNAVDAAATGSIVGQQAEAGIRPLNEPFDRNNWITLVTIAVLLLSTVFLNVNVGMGAFVAAGILGMLRAADHGQAIQKIPWNVIMMVCGVTVLVALLEKTQGLELFTDLLARVATKESVSGVVAFLTGLVSVYSSTSGVVLPAFLPTVPGISQQLGGADPVSVALAMNVGSHLVDVSPLSTIGALCIAGNSIDRDTRKLFNLMLAWGLSMTVVGGLVCYLLFRT
jgi:Na+/H+ antiporter NhaD/arsenite permease-like protein